MKRRREKSQEREFKVCQGRFIIIDVIIIFFYIERIQGFGINVDFRVGVWKVLIYFVEIKSKVFQKINEDILKRDGSYFKVILSVKFGKIKVLMLIIIIINYNLLNRFYSDSKII